jgi:hypothetical protein
METRYIVVLSKIAGAALGAAALMAFASGSVVAQPPMEKKGTTPYVTHFIFRPLMSIDIPGLGTATNLEAVGTTQNMKGEKMLDKMSARCAALSVASGDKKYIDGACVLTDSDGDQIFSTFDTRDLDKSQPEMNCGTHIITGGTGKYKGITGSEPFACITMPALAGSGGYTAMDIPHNTTWEIKRQGPPVGPVCLPRVEPGSISLSWLRWTMTLWKVTLQSPRSQAGGFFLTA